jgi:N-acyl-D-amino-acid deacylase
VFDVVLRNGRVLDGTGQPERRADIGIRDGLIVAVEPQIDTPDADVAEVIDATGRLITPGWVDIHSHYDGQATWDSLLEPSSGHGVTTVVVGNCGVGFAPVHPGEHEPLVKLMEGVEDIPGAALAEGMTWGWESFPDYLDALGTMQWSVDVGAQLPHGPLRTYVMRRYDDTNGAPSSDEVAQMGRLAQEAVEAGAFGFSTSRTIGHRSSDGTPVPGTYAAEQELLAIARGVAAGGGAILEIAPSGLARGDDPAVVAEEFEWIGRLAAQTGLATTFALLQGHHVPDRWRAEQQAAARWRASGARVTPLIAGRPFGVLWGWDVRHPFMARDSYRALAHLPLPERLAELRRPEVRAAILGEDDVHTEPGSVAQMRYIRSVLPGCFPLVDPPDYEQPVEQSLGARAEARGVPLEEVAYDALVTGSSTMLLYSLYNYAAGDHQVLYEQLQDVESVIGLSDGGAHCAFICDASIPTFMLTHWTRDRTRGPRLTVPEVVRRLTSQPADLYGMTDRGRIRPGLRADLNVIDYAALQLGLPHAVDDLPAGGTRLLQPASGYDATLVAGQVTRRRGQDTGARPGRLVRH